MNMETNKDNNFWQGFVSLVKEIENNYMSVIIYEQVDKLVQELGPYSWEIGPPNNICTNFSFTISPNMDKSLLQETKQIISSAPQLFNWSFYYAIQPKSGWNLTFFFQNTVGLKIKICGSDWKYILYEYDDGKIDIVIENPLLEKLSLDDLYSAVEILIEGIIGEELFITLVNEIEIVNSFESDVVSKQSSLKNWGNHIKLQKPY